jgi:hypothetical protein
LTETAQARPEDVLAGIMRRLRSAPAAVATALLERELPGADPREPVAAFPAAMRRAEEPAAPDNYAHAREAAHIAAARAAPLVTCSDCLHIKRRAFLLCPVVVLWCDQDGHDLHPDDLDAPRVCLRRDLLAEPVVLLDRGDYLELKRRFPNLWPPRREPAR